MLKSKTCENFKEETETVEVVENPQKSISSNIKPLALVVSRPTYNTEEHSCKKRTKPVAFFLISTDFYTAIGFEPLLHQLVFNKSVTLSSKTIHQTLNLFLVVEWWLVYWKTTKNS